MDMDMDSDVLLQLANLSALLLCSAVKFPQILALLRRQEPTGGLVRVNTIMVDIIGLVVVLTYQTHHGYAPPTYMEYPVLIAQDAVLLLLLLHHKGSLWHGPVYALLFLLGWRLICERRVILDVLMALWTFVSASSKLVQLISFREAKDSDQCGDVLRNVVNWGMSTVACAARVYTTAATHGDMQLMVRFVVLAALDLAVLSTVLQSVLSTSVLHYGGRRGGAGTPEGDRAQRQQQRAQERRVRRRQTRPN